MKMTRFLLSVGVLYWVSAGVWSNSPQHSHSPSPYAGYQTREIKSLSDNDIDDLLQGRGWGLALPAELNGLPGPVHLLELKDKLELSPEQTAQIQEIYDSMRQEAITVGSRFIQAERALNEAFEKENIDTRQLASLVNEAAEVRAQLRYIHLSRHLMTPEILTPGQIKRYAILRGYQDDPCAKIPEGHNSHMWRKHNNCH